MDDQDKVDEMVLARLHLSAFEDGGVARVWKGWTSKELHCAR